MRISTKGRYALRLMLDIAMNDAEGKPVRVKDIAKRQEVSGKYLEQIVSVLTKAGYLRSIRGPQGGYLLTKRPDEYTVGMILRITEGSMEPVPCLEEGSEVCERMEECITIPLWRKLSEAISGVLDHTTLADLIEWHYAKNGIDCVIECHQYRERREGMIGQYTLQQWILYFYVYCFLGWIFESCYVSFRKKEWVNRGFLHGPFLPIYGSGAVMMLFVSEPFKDNLILTYFAGVVGATDNRSSNGSIA